MKDTGDSWHWKFEEDTVGNHPFSTYVTFSAKLEVVVLRGSVKKVFLEMSQNSQENTSARASFLLSLRPPTLLKKRLWHRCFPVNFVKLLRTPFYGEYLWLLLLKNWHFLTILNEGVKNVSFSNNITFLHYIFGWRRKKWKSLVHKGILKLLK